MYTEHEARKQYPGLAAAASAARPGVVCEPAHEPLVERNSKSLSELVGRVENLRGRVTAMAVRLCGHELEDPKSADKPPSPDGLLHVLGEVYGHTHRALSDIEYQIGRLEREGV
jgi:hypothetical protein